MSYNTQETNEIRVSSKIDRTALTETLLKWTILVERKLQMIATDEKPKTKTEASA